MLQALQRVLDKHYEPQDILALLSADETFSPAIFAAADQVRKDHCGDEIFLRGIVEMSNHCRKNCHYCGIRKDRQDLQRYRIPFEEILETCLFMEKNQQTTVVLQAGEDPGVSDEQIEQLIREIKAKTSLAITLSLGERPRSTYERWKAAGMDRYLIRMETFDRALFASAHPDDHYDTRLGCIKALIDLGVQTGSGLLIGLPGQTLEILASDILACSALNLDMIGVGPFIPHPQTPFGQYVNPFSQDTFYRVIAILRLLNPTAHIPATTAFDAIERGGRDKLLQYGANVFMPNATPVKYRKLYMLYPDKPCVDETSAQCAVCITGRINRLGRKIGRGPGHSLKT